METSDASNSTKKKIGIIGGMSYESSLHYYERINTLINQKLGKLYTAEIIMYSVNFQSIEPYMRKNDWYKIERKLCDIAQKMPEKKLFFPSISSMIILPEYIPWQSMSLHKE